MKTNRKAQIDGAVVFIFFMMAFSALIFIILLAVFLLFVKPVQLSPGIGYDDSRNLFSFWVFIILLILFTIWYRKEIKNSKIERKFQRKKRKK